MYALLLQKQSLYSTDLFIEASQSNIQAVKAQVQAIKLYSEALRVYAHCRNCSECWKLLLSIVYFSVFALMPALSLW